MIGAVNRARAVLTALLLTSALGLAGCSDDDPEPAPAPPSSEPASPSTTAASGPTPPEMPDAAKGTDAAAAEAFVRFYWDTVNYAQETGDLTGLQSLSSEACDACRGGLRYLEDVFDRNGTIEGGDNSVSNIEVLGFVRHEGTYSDALLELELRATPQAVRFPDGADDERYAGGTTLVSMRVRLDGASPLVVSWSKR